MGVKEDIELLDDKINQLKVEYERYFIGSNKAEPLSLKKEVERLIKKYRNRLIENTALRFRYNSLVARFNTYNQYWEKRARSIWEEGRIKKEVPKPESLETRVSEEAETLIDEDRMKRLYSEYIEARRKCREPVDNISYERVKSVIEKQIPEILKKYNCKEVEFKVKIEDNKAKIKVIPRK